MSMSESRLNVGRRQVETIEIAEGFLGAHVLFALNELQVFDRLAHGPRSAHELAAETATKPEPLIRLLNGGVAVGLLIVASGRYSNSDLAATTLVSGGPGHLRDWMRWMSRLAERFPKLAECVRSGEPVEDPSLHLGGDPDFTRDFIMGMHDYARLRGSEVIRFLDLSDARRLIDVGGGPGTYAILFAKAWPDLEVTVFDLPEVVKIAQENSRAAGVGDQVHIMAGSYLENDLGEGYDVAFLSDVLHQEDPDAAAAVLRGAYRALRPGGRLVVQGMFLNEDRASPRWPVLASLIMLVIYGQGRIYSAGETMRMVEEAGFRGPELVRMSLLNVNSLVLADRP
jgi:SAM-dependent methyltransferase